MKIKHIRTGLTAERTLPLLRRGLNPFSRISVWTFDVCKAEAKKYKKRIDFQRANCACYAASARAGWLDKICIHMPLVNRWTFDSCSKDALKYNTRGEFIKSSGGCHNACTQNGWLEQVCAHMVSGKRYWTKERSILEARKYKTKKDFTSKSYGCYAACRNNKWLEEVCSHMIVLHTSWTLSEATKTALKYKTRSQFELHDKGCYSTCQKYNWMDQVCSHMPRYAQQFRHEEDVVQPKVEAYLKKMGLQVEREVHISRRSRVDFLCTNGFGRKIIIEVKSHEKKHNKTELTQQINRYQIDGKKKYGNAYSKTFLVSLNGDVVGSYSLKELKALLKQDGLI